MVKKCSIKFFSVNMAIQQYSSTYPLGKPQKKIFFNGRAIKAWTPPPIELNGPQNFFCLFFCFPLTKTNKSRPSHYNFLFHHWNLKFVSCLTKVMILKLFIIFLWMPFYSSPYLTLYKKIMILQKRQCHAVNSFCIHCYVGQNLLFNTRLWNTNCNSNCFQPLA